jgi:hypothetical protein
MAMDPGMTQALAAMLPPEVKAALDGGAAPAELAQTLLMQRLQQANEAETVVVEDDEEPWPELGWGEPGGSSGVEPLGSVPPPGPVAEDPALPFLDVRMTDVARALGACTLCFGDLPDCPVCRGEGSPGWSIPEPHLFGALVLPALRRLESEELRRAQGTARRFSSPRPPDNFNGHSATT